MGHPPPSPDFTPYLGTLEWFSAVWEFEPKTGRLEILSSVPEAATRRFPLPLGDHDTLEALHAEVCAARRAIAEGHNRAFERECGELIRLLGARVVLPPQSANSA